MISPKTLNKFKREINDYTQIKIILNFQLLIMQSVANAIFKYKKNGVNHL